MVVTKIEAVTKTKYKVYIDGQFAFILYKGELSRYRVSEGREITEETQERICGEVLVKRAKLRAMHLLNDMGRTESQLRTKLERDGYPENVTEAAVAYVKSFGYVDDLNYARNFIETRKDKKSRKELGFVLEGMGVPADCVEQAFSVCYGREDRVLAIEKLMRKRHFIPDASSYQEKQKFMAYLARKGFSYDEARQALNNINQEEELW